MAKGTNPELAELQEIVNNATSLEELSIIFGKINEETKLAKKKDDIIKARIKELFSEEETTSYGGMTIGVVDEVFSLAFNEDKFRHEHLELYISYLEPKKTEKMYKITYNERKAK